MNTEIDHSKAQSILTKCLQIDKMTASIQSLTKTVQSLSADVKAEMTAYLGGVGTASDKQKKKAEREAAIRARYHKRK